MIYKIILGIYCIYNILYRLVMSILGPCHMIWTFNGQNKKNITLSRYLYIDDPQMYWIKTYHVDGVRYLAYEGNLDDLTFDRDNTLTPIPILKRKNIMLLNGTNPVNFDLNLLDNYIQSNLTFTDKCVPITNLTTILKLFDCDATDIQIIHMAPFKKEIIPIDHEMNINMLYEY